MQRIGGRSRRGTRPGYQDFMKETVVRLPIGFEVTLFDAFMQGAEVRGVDRPGFGRPWPTALDDFDAVVLIRGGGSQSDLGSFDSYRLCCHLAQFPLPVIAGIGHDKDRSVADLVAAVSLKTPTAVAVYLKNKMAEFEALLDSLRGRLAECGGRDAPAAAVRRFLRDAGDARWSSRPCDWYMSVRCGLQLEQLRGTLRTPCDAKRSAGADDRLGNAAVPESRQAARFAFGESRVSGADNLVVDAAAIAASISLSVRRRELALTGDLVGFARSPADTGDGLFGGSPERRGAGRSARAASGRPGRDRDAFPHVRSANR